MRAHALDDRHAENQQHEHHRRATTHQHVAEHPRRLVPDLTQTTPTATASFDVLEAGDMVEGCSIGFWFGFCGFEPVRSTFCALAGFLDLRLRRRFRGDRRTVLFV